MTEEMKAAKREQMEACNAYFNRLAKALERSHIVVNSIKNDGSRYLVLEGTEADITYYGKPMFSFRVSNHWNWRSSIRRCIDPFHIQCFTKDLHYPFPRAAENRASKPVFACCVGYYGLDRQYHIVYGEVYDPKTRTTKWVERDISEVVSDMQEDIMDGWKWRRTA